jgi:hypothetical protein
MQPLAKLALRPRVFFFLHATTEIRQVLTPEIRQ